MLGSILDRRINSYFIWLSRIDCTGLGFQSEDFVSATDSEVSHSSTPENNFTKVLKWVSLFKMQRLIN